MLKDRPERQKGTKASNRRLNSKAARIETFLISGFVSIEIAAMLHARRVPVLQRMAHGVAIFHDFQTCTGIYRLQSPVLSVCLICFVKTRYVCLVASRGKYKS